MRSFVFFKDDQFHVNCQNYVCRVVYNFFIVLISAGTVVIAPLPFLILIICIISCCCCCFCHSLEVWGLSVLIFSKNHLISLIFLCYFSGFNFIYSHSYIYYSLLLSCTKINFFHLVFCSFFLVSWDKNLDYLCQTFHLPLW